MFGTRKDATNDSGLLGCLIIDDDSHQLCSMNRFVGRSASRSERGTGQARSTDSEISLKA
jgi:hypothetical protein